jgi:hypothetical protein
LRAIFPKQNILVPKYTDRSQNAKSCGIYRNYIELVAPYRIRSNASQEVMDGWILFNDGVSTVAVT